jgi:hypothetical protein
MVQRHGTVTNRPGTRYIATVKNSDDPTRLIPFIFEAGDQTYVLEFGDGYIRFYWHHAPVIVTSVPAYAGGTAYVVGDVVVSAGINYYSIQDGTGHTPASSPLFWYPLTDDIYEIPTPYIAADVGRINFAQQADTVMLVHPSYAPLVLQRLGHTTWRLIPFVTTPSIDAPTGLGASAGGAGTAEYHYVVTAAKIDSYEESYASNQVDSTGVATPTVLAPNVLTWTTVTGAAEYYIYSDPYGNGVFGFIGTATTNAFNDVGVLPDFTVTPPTPQVLFDSTDNYPSVVGYFQQRLVLANTNNDREKVWMSQVGAYTNFSISTPLQDDDAISFVLDSDYLSPVGHLIRLKNLIIFNDSAEWVIKGDPAGGITPLAINASQEGYAGALAYGGVDQHHQAPRSSVRPIVIGNTILYIQARGTVIRDFRQENTPAGEADYGGSDLTIFSPHLFFGHALTGLAYQQQPHSIAWIVREDGVLLGCTYLREQEILGWHRHDTGAAGEFEQVLVVPDHDIGLAGEDVVYFIVKRTIDGATVRFVERFASREVTDEDAFFVDAGLSYDGAPVTTITNLDHLEGEIVAVLGDSQVEFDGDPTAANAETYRVTGGSVTLSTSYGVIHAGLPIRFAEIETLDLDVQGTSIRDKRKRTQASTILVETTSPNLMVGPDATHLFRWRPEPWDPRATRDVTDQLETNLTAKFEATGKVRIRVTDPLPCTVLGIIPSVELGG